MIPKSIDHLFARELYSVIHLGSLLTVLCCTSLIHIKCTQTHHYSMAPHINRDHLHQVLELNFISFSPLSIRAGFTMLYKYSIKDKYSYTFLKMKQLHRHTSTPNTKTILCPHGCIQTRLLSKWSYKVTLLREKSPLKQSSGIMGETSFLLAAGAEWKYSATHL